MELLKIVDAAIRMEVEAKAFYLKGERESSTEDARALFRQLAGEEEQHRRMLLALYEKMAGKAYTEAEW
jgi:rubrerythrin